MLINTRRFPLILGLPTLISLSACNSDSVQEGVTQALIDPSRTVCDPFGGSPDTGGGNVGVDQGLFAQLYYLDPSQPHYSHVQDYLDHGSRVDADLYFSELNIPTRPFDRGFLKQDGSYLATPEGTTLYEWFALHFETEIRLGPNDPPGEYQFAILSDDGSVLSLPVSGGGMAPFINNDGTTPTRLGCGTSTIHMDSGTRLLANLDYFQGPRYHIALMLLWRRVPDSVVGSSGEAAWLADSECGRSGNSRFFDSTQNPPTPQRAWNGLVSRGWKALGAENFYLAPGTALNPCSPDVPGGIGS